MLKVKDVCEENLNDVFEICSGHRVFAPKSDPILKKGIEIKRQLILDLLEKSGPCIKIAYLDEKPVAQILFYPEKALPYIYDTRKDVIHLQCIYSPFLNSQRRGAGAALIKDLLVECKTGLHCLRDRPCSFVVTRTFAHEGDLSLKDFYSKYGFRQGSQEMFLEIKGDYVPRKASEYHSLNEDLGRAIILYSPLCEWGFFAAHKIKEAIHEIDSDLPVKTFNIWGSPKEYMKRPFPIIVSARVIVNAQVIPSNFWTDRENFLQDIKNLLKK